MVFVDSWLAIKEVEETHRNELHHATKLVDWKMRRFTLPFHAFLTFLGTCRKITECYLKITISSLAKDFRVICEATTKLIFFSF